MSNKDYAFKDLEGFGLDYFYDEAGSLTDVEILEVITSHIHGTRRLTGLLDWEKRVQSLEMVLAQCTDEELTTLLKNFGHTPDAVGGSRHFFEKLYKVIRAAVHGQRKRIT